MIELSRGIDIFPVFPWHREETEEEYYRKHLVVGGPGFMELEVGDKALLWRELEKHIGSIDSELLRLIREWKPTTRSALTFLTSVGAYPSKRKIKALKEALTAPNRYSDENLMRITKILLGNLRVREMYRDDWTPRPAVMDYDSYKYFEDPIEPDTPTIDYKLVGAERRRRERWLHAWQDYLLDLETRSGLPFRFEFLCDVRVKDRVNIMISPRLRLPTGEYLEPVTVTGSILPVTPVVPPMNDGSDIKPIAEDKKVEDKTSPWWVVIAVGVIALFVFTMTRR